MDSFRFVVCAGATCRRVFFLCRHCDRGDRYCSAPCAIGARRDSLQAAGRRYQHSRRGRLRHAARQARYRRPREKVTHQTSPGPGPSGIVGLPSPAPLSLGHGEEVAADAHRPRRPAPGRVRCARCGRPGRFVRHTTLVHTRPRWPARR